MPRSCACCDHPNRAAIEAAIILPGQSFRTVARAHGLTPAALHRHARNHLPVAIAAAAAGHLAAIDAGTAPSPAPIIVPEIEPAEAPPEIETSFTDAAPHVPRALDFGDGPTDAPAPQGSPLTSIPAAPAPSHQPEAMIAPSAAPEGLRTLSGHGFTVGLSGAGA